MGWIDKAEKKIRKKVVSEVEDFVEDLIDDATDAIGDVRDVAQNAVKEAQRANKRISWYADKGIEQVVNKTGSKLVDELKDCITEEMLEGIADALDDAADIIEVLAPDQFGLVFGVEVALVVQCEVTVSLDIPNPVARLTEIRAWADDPPKGRAQIIECIKDFGPDGLSVEAKVSGNGFSASWSGDDKYDRIDAFLEKHGVK